MMQAPAGFVPDAAPTLPDGFVADTPPPDFRAENEPPSKSLWEQANTPLLPQIADAAHAIADHLDAPKLDRGVTEAQIRGFLAGATGAAGDVAASFTSPVGIAMTLATLNPDAAIVSKIPGASALLKLPAVQTLQKAVRASGGTAFALHGAHQAITAPDVAGKIAGVAEAASGAAIGAPAYADLAGQVSDAVKAWQTARRTAQGAQATAQLQQAIPPSKGTPYSEADLHRALPYLDVQHAGEPVESVDALRKAADASIKAIEDHVSSAIAAQPSTTITVDPVQSLRSALAGNPRADFVKKGITAVVKDYPQLKGPISLAEADRIRRALNADLDAMSAKNGYQLATAREADADFAAREAIGKLLRAQVYQGLERGGVADVADLRRDEGSLIAVRNAAQRQIYAGDKTVGGSAPTSALRTAASVGVRAIPAPALVTDAVARVIKPAALTHDALVANAMRARLSTGLSSTLTPIGTIPPVASGLSVHP